MGRLVGPRPTRLSMGRMRGYRCEGETVRGFGCVIWVCGEGGGIQARSSAS